MTPEDIRKLFLDSLKDFPNFEATLETLPQEKRAEVLQGADILIAALAALGSQIGKEPESSS